MGTVPQDAPGDPMNLQQALENIQRGGNQRGAAQVPIAPSPGMGLREYFTQSTLSPMAHFFTNDGSL